MSKGTQKAIRKVGGRRAPHWVGDGFPVTSVLSPQEFGNELSPYILFDYAAPFEFAPSEHAAGVDTHPHRGFETVTVVFQGGLQHRDSAGNRGTLGPGDVQWMTAASGILHEEKHSEEFRLRGGVLEMAQLWVNLPAREKSSPPRYQDIAAKDIPSVLLPNGAGSVRNIAGELFGVGGAARTVTPVILWDVSLSGGCAVELPIPAGYGSGVFVRRGAILINGQKVSQGEFALMERDGDVIAAESAGEPAELLVLGGQPLGEPVVAYGPFVMNSQEEIRTAIADLHSGRFGTL